MAEFEALIIKNIAAVGGVGVGIALIQVCQVQLNLKFGKKIKRFLSLVNSDLN